MLLQFVLFFLLNVAAGVFTSRKAQCQAVHDRFVQSKPPSSLLTPNDKFQWLDLGGVQLKFAFWNCVEGDRLFMEYSRKAFDELAVCLNFSYVMSESCEEFSAYSELMRSGKLDLTGLAIQSPERHVQATFLHPFIQTRYAIVIRKPPPYTTPSLTVLSPFDTLSWVLVCGFLLSGTVILKLCQRVGPARGKSISYNFMFVFGTVLKQGGTYNSRCSYVRIFMSCWWIFVIVVSAIYTGTLVSFFSVTTRTEYPFTSLEEAASSKLLPTVVDKYAALEWMQSGQVGSYQWRLLQKLKSGGQGKVVEVQEALGLALTGKYFFISDMSYGSVYLATDYTNTKECRYTFAPFTFSDINIGWAVSHDSPYQEPLNQGLLKLFENGLMQKWWREIFPSAMDSCLAYPEPEIASFALSINHVAFILLVPVVGAVGGLLILLIEGTASCLHSFCRPVKVSPAAASSDLQDSFYRRNTANVSSESTDLNEVPGELEYLWLSTAGEKRRLRMAKDLNHVQGKVMNRPQESSVWMWRNQNPEHR